MRTGRFEAFSAWMGEHRLCGAGLAFLNPVISQLLYVCVALLWLIPDRRIEAHLAQE